MRDSHKIPRHLVGTLFFSGLTALVYEVLWFRIRWRALLNGGTERFIRSLYSEEISADIFLEVYSPVSANPSTGMNSAALLENRQVTEAGKSSSAS